MKDNQKCENQKFVGFNVPYNNEVAIGELVVTYTQESYVDSDSSEEMKITTRGEGGTIFHVIQTDGWAVNSLDDLTVIFDKIKKTINGL